MISEFLGNSKLPPFITADKGRRKKAKQTFAKAFVIPTLANKDQKRSKGYSTPPVPIATALRPTPWLRLTKL